jgi:hypothetical protein
MILPGNPDGGSFFIQEPKGFKFVGEQGTFGAVISAALNYIFPIAGRLLFFLIVFSGFKLLTSAGNEEKMAQAKKSLTNAVIGFFIIFLSYWLVQIVSDIFGISAF